MRKKVLVFCICLFVFSFSSIAQVGKEFWFVAPDITSGHGDEPIMFRITALDNAANVRVSMPGSGKILGTINIPAFTQKNFILNKNIVENIPSNRVNNKGIQILSDQKITAYYEVANGVNPDKFTLKGPNALGREFYVPSQNLYRNKPLNPKATEKVDIVATEDKTTVIIIPTADIVGHKANVPFTIILNKGQTFCLENRNDTNRKSSLAGTYLSSDKYIAVTISDDSVWEEYNLYGNHAGPYDLIGDQLIPTSLIGTEYIGINTSTDTRTINKVFVLATQDNTFITVNNDATLVKGPYKKGEQIDLDITDNAIYISSNRPVVAYQLASFWNTSGNEIGSAVLPSVNCTGSQTVSFVRSFTKKFYAQLMTQGKSIRSFVFKDQAGNTLTNLSGVIFDQNGNSYSDLNSIPWTKVKGTDGGSSDDTWYTAVVSLSITTSVPYTIANNDGLFHMSILDENQGSTSYGYFSSYGELRIEGPTQECQGSVVVLSTSEPMKSYNWFSEHTGNVVQSTDAQYAITQSGKYWVASEVNFGGCVLIDTIDVEFKMPEFDLGPDTIICPDEIITVGVESGLGDYLWSDGTTSNETSLALVAGQTSTISLTVTDESNCSNTDSKVISTHPLPVIVLNKKEVCRGGRIIADDTNIEKFEWKYNGTVLNTDLTQNYFEPAHSGVYTLTVWGAEGCPVTKNFNVTVRALPTFDVQDQLGCIAATTIVNAPLTGAGYSYLWSDNSTGASLGVNAVGDYWLEITDQYGCKDRDNFSFGYLPPAKFDLGPDKEECAGITLQIDQASSYSNFTWKFKQQGTTTIVDLPTPTPEYEYKIENSLAVNSGDYYVSAIDLNGCEVADDVNIIFHETADPVLNLSENLCDGDTIKITTSEGYSTYEWYLNGTVIPFENSSSIKVAQPGNYQVVAVFGGCTKTDNVVVNKYDNPLVVLSALGSICPEVTGVIEVNSFSKGASPGSGDFDYLIWSSGQMQSDWTTAELKINMAGDYSVIAYDTRGCSTADTISVGQFNKTVINLPKLTETCENVTVTLSNPVANTIAYEWYKLTAGGDNLLVSGADWVTAEDGSYRLRINDVNGCENADTVVIKSLPIPKVDLGPDREMCEGDSLVLRADPTFTTYRWNGDNNLNTSSLLVSTSSTYTVEVANADGCWSQDEVDVIVNALPKFTLDDYEECPGTEVVLSAPAGLSNFKWSTGETTQDITVKNGTYTLEATSPKGCVGKATAHVKWYDAPRVDIGDDAFICPVDFLQLVAPDGFDYYEWHNGSNERSIIANFADTVNFVKVRDGNNCWGFDSRMVKDLPAPEYELSPDAEVCEGDSIILDAGEDYLGYRWFDGSMQSTYTVRESGEYWVSVLDGCFWLQDTTNVTFNETPVIARLDTSIYGQVVIFPEGGTEPYIYAINEGEWQDENVFKKLENGTYILQVEDINTCSASDTIILNTVIDIDIPNFITPNNDGFNDRWEIDGMEKFPDSIIRIYDRFGKLLIEYKASEPGWNGEYLGKPVPSDAYWYVIEVLPIEKFLKGHLTLKR